MINIQTDSRKIKQGDTFVALRGIRTDGHDYIEGAIQNGASRVVVEEGSYDVETIVVEDTREYLKQYLRENYAKYLNEMNLIGVTGTNGKTTTAYLTYSLLNRYGIKTAYIGTIGFYIENKVCNLPNTTVDTCDLYDFLIQAYDAGCKSVVLEISSHALSMGRIQTLSFDMAIFTNLTQDHLDYHKTMGNYALAKQKLFKQLKPNGKAIVNIDDKYTEYFLLNDNFNITYGFGKSDYQITEYHMNTEGSLFTFRYHDTSYSVKTKLLGKYNMYNMLAVIAICKELGLSMDGIRNIIPTLDAPVGRMEIIHYKNSSIVIDYAHTPDAIEKVIKVVQEISKGKTYVVFGCTGDRDRLKRPMMTELVGHLSDYFIITNDDPHFEDPKQIVDDMTKDTSLSNYEVCLDRETAIIKGIQLLNEEDVLFILGKGHEEYMLVRDDKIPFNDRKVVEKYLNELQKDE